MKVEGFGAQLTRFKSTRPKMAVTSLRQRGSDRKSAYVLLAWFDGATQLSKPAGTLRNVF